MDAQVSVLGATLATKTSTAERVAAGTDLNALRIVPYANPFRTYPLGLVRKLVIAFLLGRKTFHCIYTVLHSGLQRCHILSIVHIRLECVAC